MATINEILNAIKVSRDQGFSEADIATGLARYGITASQIANATASTYTPTQIENAINVSRQQGFSDADITTGLARYGVTTAQPYVDPSSGRSTGLADPSKFTSPTTYTPAQIANAINVSRQQGFSEADVATGLGRFLPNSAAVTAALAANPKASPVTPSAITPIARPPAPTQFTNTQVTPAAVTNTAITGTPYTNVYTPPTMQRNAPTLAQISAASQSANPYQSLMALTPQRTLSPAYAGMLGQTTANTNQGGFNPAIYNPAATPVTGLLNTTGGGGNDGSQNGAGGGGGGIPGLNIDPVALAAARVANLFGSSVSLGKPATVTDATFNPTQAGIDYAGASGKSSWGKSGNANQDIGPSVVNTAQQVGGGRISSYQNDVATAISNAKMEAAAIAAADNARYGPQIAAAAANEKAAQDAAAFAGAQAATAAAAADAAQAASDNADNPSGANAVGTSGGGFAKGGMVNMKPQMRNPPGPDDGYAALDNGEYVIRKSAVKKYGSNILEQINAGRIPAQRLKSLLE